MHPPLAPCGSAIQRSPLIPYLRAIGYQPPEVAPIYSARSVRSSSLSLNLNGSSSVPMMMSGPAPTLAATADFGRMSSQLSASTRTLTPVFSVNFLVLATKLSNSAWMNCFQRKTRIEAPASGAGPFQAGSARAAPGTRSNPAAPPDCKTWRLVKSANIILPCARHEALRSIETTPGYERTPRRRGFRISCSTVSRLASDRR